MTTVGIALAIILVLYIEHFRQERRQRKENELLYKLWTLRERLNDKEGNDHENL